LKFCIGLDIIKAGFSKGRRKAEYWKGARPMDKTDDQKRLCFACKHKYQDDNSEPCVSCRKNGFKKFEKRSEKQDK